MSVTLGSVRAEFRAFTEKLIATGRTVTLMESATGGFIASLITDTEGSSGAFRGSYVTYSNEAKIKCGVRRSVIDRYSVYSRECALEMARACRAAYGADIGIGVTGTMGNRDPENPEWSVPGRLFFAIETRDGAAAYEAVLPPLPDRPSYKIRAAHEVALALKSLK